MLKPLPFLGGLLALSAIVILYGLSNGSLASSIGDVWNALINHQQGMIYQVIQQLRLPRVISGFTTGALLALSGALMQVLLRNPLADPYILGVSGGAAVMALSAMLLGASSWLISGSAFIGALFSMLLVFILSHGRGGWNGTRLLLTGVVIAAGWGAVISLLLALSPEFNLRGMLYWLMGDLSQSGDSSLGLVCVAIALVTGLLFARHLNLLSAGELQARALGVPVFHLRMGLYFMASLLAATAIMQAGSIGFIGLIVPHMIRLTAGSDHRVLLPGCVLLGGSLLVFADTLARTVMAPQQLPVGVITALLGVPVFLFILHRGTRGRAR